MPPQHSKHTDSNNDSVINNSRKQDFIVEIVNSSRNNNQESSFGNVSNITNNMAEEEPTQSDYAGPGAPTPLAQLEVIFNIIFLHLNGIVN